MRTSAERAERAFFTLALLSWAAKVLTDAGAPRGLLTVLLAAAAVAAAAARGTTIAASSIRRSR